MLKITIQEAVLADKVKILVEANRDKKTVFMPLSNLSKRDYTDF
ncbi:hypothetical protein [Leuconostoc litchii]|nr:hypothetical protein [Leuconostoc litchii]